MTEILLILLLIAVNGSPIVARLIFKSMFATPIDFGIFHSDGCRFLGNSKTWRGIISGLLVSIALSELMGFGIGFGAIFGGLVLLGDLIASFIKRRKRIPSSDQALGWDQIPESLLPLIYAAAVLPLAWWEVPLLVMAFFVIELLISKPLYHLRIRHRPY